MSEPSAWMRTVESISALQFAAEAYSVLLAAQRAGLLDLLAPGTTAGAASDALGVRAGRVEAVLDVLAAHGVAEHDGQVWQLAAGWDDLVRGETPIALDAFLGTGRVRAEQVSHALEFADDYWGLEPSDRLLVARGVSFDPANPASQDLARRTVASMHGLEQRLEQGGSVLELGCGVGGRLTALLLAFPTATGVGVELDEALVAWGRERAERLGLGDRLELVAADATEYEPEELFDQVQWSQFFFPEESRVGALATARLGLRAGGWVNMPVIWDGSPLEVGSYPHKEMAAERVVLDLWRVPLKTTHDVVAELEAAGFVDVHVVEAPEVHYVRGRQP
jgi:SAM-dependent methyltransferase